MTQVIFYLLDDDNADAASHLVCDIAAAAHAQRQRCFVLCQSQQQAEQLDELLWQRPAERFVPHNLVGEGPKGGAPVELGWQQAPSYQRPLLINLQAQAPDNAVKFQTIIDFVPAEEQQKAAARERFKHYRRLGVAPQTQAAKAFYENTHG